MNTIINFSLFFNLIQMFEWYHCLHKTIFNIDNGEKCFLNSKSAY